MKQNRAAKILAAIVAALGFALVSTPAIAVAPAPGVTTYTTYFDFSSGEDTFSFDVSAAQGSGKLTVETLDCCIPGDLWVSFLSHSQPTGKDTATATGNGSTFDFTGSASRNGWSKGTVTFSYDAGVDIFPAGIYVQFTYTPTSTGGAKGNTGMIVTPI